MNIFQAREANAFDEVSMLETNLKMLQEEFGRQKEDEARVKEEERVREKGVEGRVEEMRLDDTNPFSEEEEAYVSFPPRSRLLAYIRLHYFHLLRLLCPSSSSTPRPPHLPSSPPPYPPPPPPAPPSPPLHLHLLHLQASV